MNYPQTIIHHEKTRQKVTYHFKTTDTTCTTSATHTTPGIVVFQLSYVPRTQRNTLFKVVWVALFYRSLCYRIGISLKSWRDFSKKATRFQWEGDAISVKSQKSYATLLFYDNKYLQISMAHKAWQYVYANNKNHSEAPLSLTLSHFYPLIIKKCHQLLVLSYKCY